jgi:hypothetical protein
MKDVGAKRIKRDKAIADALEAMNKESREAHEACKLRIDEAKRRHREAYDEARRAFEEDDL